jgi:hypothetical protein
MTEPHRPHRILASAALLAFLAAGCSSSSSSPAPEVTPKAPVTEVHWNGEALQENAFAPLPLGSVKARGWLQQQLRIQADGLTGHLEEIWPDVGPDSGWLGGRGESWERGPYYVDGLLPLAYLLEDEALMAKAEKWVAREPARRRLDRRHRKSRLVAEHGHAESADAVPRGHR